MHPTLISTLAIVSGLVSWAATGVLIPLLRRAAVLDRPNERSLHAAPVPRGGGIAVTATTLAAWLVAVAAGLVPPAVLAVLCAAALLAAISWLDDLRNLSPAMRLIAHAAAVTLGLVA